MADQFDLNAFNQRVVSSLERRRERRVSVAPPTLIDRLKAVRRSGRKLRTLPRV